MTLIAFAVPTAAADAIRIDLAAAVAPLAGVIDQRLAYDYADAQCRVRCSREMAICLVEAFRMRAADPQSSADVVTACAEAVATALAALERDIAAANS